MSKIVDYKKYSANARNETPSSYKTFYTERVDFQSRFRLLLTGKVDAEGVFFERLSFNVERRGMENKYSGMLAWEETILYLCM